MSKCDGCMRHGDCIKTANYKLVAECTEYVDCNDCVHLDGIDYPEGPCYWCDKIEDPRKYQKNGNCPHFIPRGEAQ